MGALDVPQKLVSQALAGCGALDETGDIGKHKLAFTEVDYAEIRRKGGKGVVGDLRGAQPIPVK